MPNNTHTVDEVIRKFSIGGGKSSRFLIVKRVIITGKDQSRAVDFRKYYQPVNGTEPLPTQKGICVNKEELVLMLAALGIPYNAVNPTIRDFLDENDTSGEGTMFGHE